MARVRCLLLTVVVLGIVACRSEPPRASEPISGIAFVSDRDGNDEIYRIQPDGSALLRLTDNPALDRDPAWSPDGRQIAFRSRRDGSSDIFVMAADGARPFNLACDTKNSFYDEFAPVWNPDGETFALYTDRYALRACLAHQLALMPVTGGVENIVLADVPPGNQISFAWSPDGESLVFSASYCGGTGSHLYLWDRTTGFVFPVMDDTGPPALYPAWSHNGRYIAYASGSGNNHDIYVLDTMDDTVVNLTQHPARDTQPAWSPDDRFIAFVTDRDGNDEIYIMDADGSNPRNLTQHPAADFSPSWSPVLISHF